MPLFFLGTREWRNRQTRTVQVRVPVMEWGFNSPLAHDETADPSGSAVFVFPGCGLWPRWCSGRRRARPPARLGGLTSFGAAPRSPPVPSGPSGALHTGGARCAGVWLGASSRGPPWPCRHPPAPRPGPAAHGRRSLALLRPPVPTSTAARLSGPSGVLHTSGAWCTDVWLGALSREPARPCHCPRVPHPCPVPRSVPYPQFRMQFPDTCSLSLSEKPGISMITFQSMKCARGNCMRICADPAPPPPMGAAARPCRPAGPVV